MPKLRDILDAVEPLLSALGFRKRAGGIFTAELAPGAQGWLGLNHALRRSGVPTSEINPVVGVRFEHLEKLVAECRQLPYHPYVPPSFSTSLGYVTPECRYYPVFFSDATMTDSAASLAALVKTHALPFMRSNLSMARLRERLAEGMSAGDEGLYRLPAAAFLDGDKVAARAIVAETLASLGLRKDAAASNLREFLERLLHKF